MRRLEMNRRQVKRPEEKVSEHEGFNEGQGALKTKKGETLSRKIKAEIKTATKEKLAS